METTLEFQSVPVAALEVLSREAASDISLYFSGPSQAPVLYRAAGQLALRPDYHRLRESGVTSLMVRGEHLGECERLLEEELSSVLAQSDVAPEQKAEYIHHVGASVAKDLAASPDSLSIERASSLLDEVIDCILTDPAVASGLLRVAAHDCSTASHMFAVSTLAIVLGAETLSADRDALRRVGLAGMMHDLGKVAIPQEILNKTDALDHRELQVIQHHPVESVRLLGADSRFPMSVRQMILQHHERIDGRGYPLGLRGSEILPGSRILAIVDSFHAMIGQRPYRSSLTAGQAVRAMSYGVGKQFDADFFSAWERIIRGCWPDALAEIAGASDPQPAADEHRDHCLKPPPRNLQGRAVRHLCNGRVKIECIYVGRLPDATTLPDRFVCSLRDLSRSGLGLYTRCPMYAGEVVHFLIQLPTGVTWVSGRVAWCRRQSQGPGYRTGIQLTGRVGASETPRRVDSGRSQSSAEMGVSAA